ncbi:MAG: DEAD/DEAH box helicase domain-containing protein [Parcubacteria group bacterium Gr01-1014_72]|nr:MAG: DEAD/DEAH box helicase domain-containing protein [Parcubacteria group bacterium Gr01-1014_72]
MRKIVFDIETKNEFRETGSNDPRSLSISVVGICDVADDSYRAYVEEEFKELWPILEKTDLLIGFNSDHFDIPLLNKYYAGDLGKIRSLDLMKEVQKVLGRRIKLDTLAEATLGRKKISNGLEAIRWWKQGEVEKVKRYCLEDVALTKELYDYARSHGHLKYTDSGTGTVKEIPIDASHWERERGERALTHTLPF